MANDRAMVVGFDGRRAGLCQGCNNACDHACPMRLHPRTLKRKMFTCTECGAVVSYSSSFTDGCPGGSIVCTPPSGSFSRSSGHIAPTKIPEAVQSPDDAGSAKIGQM